MKSSVGLRVAFVVCGCCIAYKLKQLAIRAYYRRKLNGRRAAKKERMAKLKEDFKKYLDDRPMSQEEIDLVTQLPFLELVEQLKNGQLPHAYVLLAYQHKAFQVDQQLNCVVEFLYPNLNEVNLEGPLAGVPVSLKETFSLKGLDCCAGLSINIGKTEEKDALAVRMIRDVGGVPFARTNVPQTLMSVLCSNPINGETRNPLNVERSPGGSSGGEGALVGAAGSPIGFGTDLGGSIRIPAAMCGVVGYKPTTGRLSYKDLSRVAASKIVMPTWGPLCRDTGSCAAVMKCLITSNLLRKEDPTCPPVPFSNIPAEKRLKIGYFLDMKCIVPNPAVRRAIFHVKQRLEARGHELVEWQLPFDGEESMSLFIASAFADGGTGFLEATQYDVIDPVLRGSQTLFTMSRLKKLFWKTYARLTHDWDSLLIFNASDGLGSVNEVESTVFKIARFKQRVFESWRASGFDAILCPLTGFAAALPLRPKQSYTTMLSFSNLANVLGIPAGTVPSGLYVTDKDLRLLEEITLCSPKIHATDQEDVAYFEDYKNKSSAHRNQFILQSGTENLPIAVQLMSLPWEDEICLHAMHEVAIAVA